MITVLWKSICLGCGKIYINHSKNCPNCYELTTLIRNNGKPYNDMNPVQYKKWLEREKEREKNRKQENIEKIKSKAERYAIELANSPTASETLFTEILQHYKIEYEFQKIIFYKNAFRIVDFYIPLKKPLVVEIDGGYHKVQRIREKDAKRTEWLKKVLDCNILRFSNEQLEKFSNNSCLVLLNRINELR